MKQLLVHRTSSCFTFVHYSHPCCTYLSTPCDRSSPFMHAMASRATPCACRSTLHSQNTEFPAFDAVNSTRSIERNQETSAVPGFSTLFDANDAERPQKRYRLPAAKLPSYDRTRTFRRSDQPRGATFNHHSNLAISASIASGLVVGA